jgi:hypothetical protein
MTRSASIGIRVEPDLKAAVEKAAKDDGRTVAQWIERLMTSTLREKGYLRSPEELSAAHQTHGGKR